MSYVSGFMLGASLGKGIHQLLFGDKPAKKVPAGRAYQARPAARTRFQREENALEPLQLVSNTPGRRRYRAVRLSPTLARLLEVNLPKLDYVETVQANPVSGSILITFAVKDAPKIDVLAHWLKRTIFDFDGAEPLDPVQAGEAARAGDITRSVRQTARDFSGWIKKNTGDVFDISSMASLLFLLRGLRKTILTHQYPSGSQMLWWALSLMRGWKTV